MTTLAKPASGWDTIITLSKGGTAERQVKLSHLEIPDLWHLAQSLPNPHRRVILECWNIAHDLKRHIGESD